MSDETRTILTVDDLLAELGGTGFVADKLGTKSPTVSNWLERGVPPSRWTALVALAVDLGKSWITLEVISQVRVTRGLAEAEP